MKKRQKIPVKKKSIELPYPDIYRIHKQESSLETPIEQWPSSFEEDKVINLLKEYWPTKNIKNFYLFLIKVKIPKFNPNYFFCLLFNYLNEPKRDGFKFDKVTFSKLKKLLKDLSWFKNQLVDDLGFSCEEKGLKEIDRKNAVETIELIINDIKLPIAQRVKTKKRGPKTNRLIPSSLLSAVLYLICELNQKPDNAYILLGELIAKLEGKPTEEEENIRSKLRMRATEQAKFLLRRSSRAK